MSEVANTILHQLSPQGPRGLKLMLGVDVFIAGPNSVSFRFKGSRKVNCLRIVLTASDTYDLTFTKARGSQLTNVSEHKDIYAEDLRNLFETTTGLQTAVPRITVDGPV